MTAQLRLRPPQHRVDPRCRGWWASRIGLLVGVPAVVLFVLGVLLDAARPWLWWPAALLALVAIGGAVVVPPVLFRIHRWEVTDEAVYARSGWLWQEWRAAPLSRVQTVDVERSPLQRVFGLATLTVTTASAKGPVRIEALANEQAEQISHRLTVLTEQVSAGAADRDAT
ncbi:PH domain-containing protein [Nakamurella lactea]|uniref:PH domain-containing protein n=1 Tax=Nakamurella lactea TaxID=459515 RepID=UPI000427EA2F|nr:PH domain-containing protein [Nakamurella lactea]